MTARPRVLILSRDCQADPCVPLVVRALEARGAEAIAIDTQRFPGEMALSLELDGEAASASLGGVDLTGLTAAWIRHLESGAPPEELPEEERDACSVQSDAALWALAGALDCYLLDPPEALMAAPSKARQQLLAARAGLQVPRTLVTNSPDAVRSFAKRLGGPIICKLIESGGMTVADGDEAVSFPTSSLEPEDLESADGLAGLELGPMIVQERLDKKLELRVTIVGQKAFVAAVDPKGAIDVRMDPALVRGLRAYDGLPPEVTARLLALTTTLGLDFASLDVVLTGDGRWVFLEANSVSFFDHVEEFAGLPISGAVADLLLGLAPRRVQRAHRPWKR
jgi:glutathione synthase/RimK-type ligase-like ATP-grasp enzyme